jgi:uncharacterized repeat protein (TIGR03803 family)
MKPQSSNKIIRDANRMFSQCRQRILVSLMMQGLLVLAGIVIPTVLPTTTDASPALRVLANFSGGFDGEDPQPGLVASSNMLYGVVFSSGDSGTGIIFGVNANSTGYTNLHSFSALPGYLSGTNNDGAYPASDLVLAGNALYGTTVLGGASGDGAIFRINTDGTGFTNLYSFAGGSDGANPYQGLVLAGGTLYGITTAGGSSGLGTVFSISTNGMGYTNLHRFTALDPLTQTNSDGANPRGRLVLAGNTLFGTAPNGGVAGFGTVYRLNSDGNGFTNMYSFTGGSDGANPFGGLSLSGNMLYGTARYGGNSGSGVVFKIATNGTSFTNLHVFTALDPSTFQNSDGANPYAGVVLSGNVVYGTAEHGGGPGYGTLFSVGTDGKNFTTLYSFTDAAYDTNIDGSIPRANLILSGSTLYGATSGGGATYYGTAFALSLVPTLGIVPAGNQVVLSWPTWAPGFVLETATNTSDGLWSNVLGANNTVGGMFVVTNAAAGKDSFFRLKGQ